MAGSNNRNTYYHRFIKEHPNLILPEKITADFLNEIYSNQYSERTILNYAYDLDLFFKFLLNNNPALHNNEDELTLSVLNQMTIDDFREFKSYIGTYIDSSGRKKRSEGASINRRLSTLRSLFKFLQVEGLIDRNPMPGVTNVKTKQKEITYLEMDEITNMLKQVDNIENNMSKHQKAYQAKSKMRDYAILITFVSTGLRVSELVGIDIDKIDFKGNAMYVHRKGNKEQFVYFSDDVKEAILGYIETERKPLDQNDKALFLSNRGTRITVRSVERIVKKYTQDPSVTIKHITPHKLRSTFGTNLYQETGDIYLTSAALNHKSVSTTASHYSAIDDSRRKQVKDINFVKKDIES